MSSTGFRMCPPLKLSCADHYPASARFQAICATGFAGPHSQSQRLSTAIPSPGGEGQDENSPKNSRIEPLNRSRRGNEADIVDSQQGPPPHLGGYEREVHGQGEPHNYLCPCPRQRIRKKGNSDYTLALTPALSPGRGESFSVPRQFMRLDLEDHIRKASEGEPHNHFCPLCASTQ